MFIALTVSLEVVRGLRPVVAQLKTTRSSSSVPFTFLCSG